MVPNRAAQELILEVLRQKNIAQDAGVSCERVVMSRGMYEIIEQYRVSLGELADASLDYLSRYSIFGLAIFVDSGVTSIRVE